MCSFPLTAHIYTLLLSPYCRYAARAKAEERGIAVEESLLQQCFGTE